MSDILTLPSAGRDDAPIAPAAAPAATPPPEAATPEPAPVAAPQEAREPAVTPDPAAPPAAQSRPDPVQEPDIDLPPTEVNGVEAIDDAPSFSARFAAAWRQRTVETDVWDYTGRVIGELRDELWDALPRETQERLQPEFDKLDAKSSIYFDANAAKRQLIMDELAKERTGEAHGAARHPTTEAEFQEIVLQRRRDTYDQAGEVLAVDGAGLGGFLGGLSRDLVDPVNLTLMPFGVQGGILRTFAAESILGGVAGAASLPREFTVADELDLPRPDALTRIGTEALASGVLGAGIVAVVRGARSFKSRRAAVRATKPEDVPVHVHEDAQAEAEARLREEVPERELKPRDQGKPPDFDFSATGNASPRTNRVGYVFGKLLEHGLEPHVAAGFVGNFMVESTTSLQPAIRGDGGAAHGIAQWNDRAPALMAFARKRGTDWTDLDTQIEFVMHELHTTEAGAWARIRQARTAAEAAALVSRYYERPGVPHMDRRVGYAQGIIDQFESGQVPKGGSAAPATYAPQTTRAGYTSQGQVRTAAGTRIDVEYAVVDASTLVRASGDLQPRDRSLGNSDEQIANMAATLDPALLMPAPTADRGAPIIGPDNVIESGNGRFGAIIRAAENHPDRIDAYRQQIVAAGFDIPDDVRTPVLVGRRVSDLDADARRSFVVEAQDSGVARMTPVERSRAEGAALNAETLARLDPSRPLDDVANAGFLRAALDRLPRSERNAFVTPEGRLNADGRAAMERALFARAFNDPDLLRRFTEQDAAELKSLLDALFEASPAWARLVADVADGKVRPEFDITGHVLEAMRTISAARRIAANDGLKVANVLSELLDEVDLLEGAMSPLTRALIAKFWRGGRAAPKDEVAGFLTRYATEARKVGGTGGDLFAAPDVPDVLRAVDKDTFADLTETGPARGQSVAPAPKVEEVLPENSFNEGAASRDAIDADAFAADDLRASIEDQPFGPVLKGFEDDWRGAVDALTARQTGEAPGALSHPDIGPIALVWGEAGTGPRTGFGLAKILARHPEVMGDLQSRLSAATRVVREGENRIQLESETDTFVISKDFRGEKRPEWLLTAFGKQRGADRSMGRVSELPEGSSPSAPLPSKDSPKLDDIQDDPLANLRARRNDLLSDGDFAVPLEGGRTIKASELLDDLDGDQVLDTVIDLCTTGGRA